MATPPIKRLSKPYEYRQAYKEARLIKGEFLRVWFLQAADTAIKLGISVGRSIDKRATARNRIKRIVREWFRSQKQICTGGCAIIVKVVKKPAGSRKAASQLIRQELATLLKKPANR